MPSPKQFIDALEDLIVANTELSKSKLILDAKLNPKQIVDKVFSVVFQTSDTNKDQGRDRLYLAHEVFISYVNIVNPHNQVLARNDSLDIESKIVKAIIPRENMIGYSIAYKKTDRTLSPNRDYYLTVINLHVEHYWEITNS